MKNKHINGHEVHPVGIGTWRMGSGTYPDKTHFAVYGHEEYDIAAIRYSLSLGQNHIDTAQIYGVGHTEEIVGEAIHGYDRKKLFIASKLWKSHLKGDAILRAIEGMLVRLNTSYLDLVYLHGYWEEYEPVKEQLQGLKKALDRKLIQAIGVSNFTLEQLKNACQITTIAAIQNYYSLTNRSWAPSELLSFCHKEHIAFVAAKPLERGALLSNDFLLSLCEKYKKTPAQLALAWLLNQENVHVIPKASEKKHIEENMAACFELSSEDQSFLSQIHAV